MSVVLGIRQRKNLTAEKKIAEILKQVQAKKEEGEAIAVLNPAKARELFKEADQILKEINFGKASPELNKEKEELVVALSSVLREHEVTPLVVFDLELVKEKATASDFSFSAGQLVILDIPNLAVYALGLKDKKSAIIAGGQDLKDPSQVAALWPKAFILTKEGVVQVDKETILVIKADKDWGKIIDLQTFAGNLYLLDEKTIWLYPAAEGGFGAKRNWLKETQVDFSDATGMAIDGSIWVLKLDGAILRFTRGTRERVAITGLDKPLANPRSIYTDSEQSRLYILDNGNSRVVVLAKTGEYDSQYIGEGIKDASGLVAQEKEKKIFLLSGSKIYEIGMR